MPNCIRLSNKVDLMPVSFQEVDDTMRLHFGAPPDLDAWFCNWYNELGLSLAMGKTLPELLERNRQYRDEHAYCDDAWCDYDKLCDVITYLNTYYVVDCWYESKH